MLSVLLRQLLIDIGIGSSKSLESGDNSSVDLESVSADAGHRCLIFCQSKALLDLIEDMFKYVDGQSILLYITE